MFYWCALPRKSNAVLVNLGWGGQPAGMKYLQEAKYFRAAPCQSPSQFTSTAASDGGLILYLPIFTGWCNNMGGWKATRIDRIALIRSLLAVATLSSVNWKFHKGKAPDFVCQIRPISHKQVPSTLRDDVQILSLLRSSFFLFLKALIWWCGLRLTSKRMNSFLCRRHFITPHQESIIHAKRAGGGFSSSACVRACAHEREGARDTGQRER